MKFFSVNFINRTIQILLLFLFIINTGAAFYVPLFAVFVTHFIIGATLTTIGIAVGIYSITKSALQIPIAKSLDLKVGEKDDFAIIFAGSVIGTIYSFSLLLISHTWQLYSLEFLSGIGDACVMAAYYAIFSHHIDKNSEGFEWSLFSVGGLTVSTALGGVIGGVIAQTYGFHVIFISAGILNILGTLLLIVLYPHIKILRKAHHYKTVRHENRPTV